MPVDAPLGSTDQGPVNVFVHGYRSLNSPAQLDAAVRRIASLGLPGRSFLLNWASGSWRQAFRDAGVTLAGLRTAYRVARLRHALAPWMLLVDAGAVGLAEVAAYRAMERRAGRIGPTIAPLLRDSAGGRVVNLIGHSLGARVVHQLLAGGDLSGFTIGDVVMLAGAADLGSDDWPACLHRIDGQLFNGYNPSDRVLRLTPDLRRRVGQAPFEAPASSDATNIVNRRLDGVSHVDFWTKIDRVLPRVWTRVATRTQ